MELTLSAWGKITYLLGGTLIQTPHRLTWVPLKGYFEVGLFRARRAWLEAYCRGFSVVSFGPEIRTVKTTIRIRSIH
jgi:hypothetical protein